jgi:Tol biopolymer transport system component
VCKRGSGHVFSPGGARRSASKRASRTDLPVQLDFDPDWNVYVINPDGSGELRLTDDEAIDSSPAWSPDGKAIVFHSTRDGYPEIFTMDAATGGQVKNLQGDESGETPSWARSSASRLPAETAAANDGAIDFVSQLGRGQDLDLYSLELAGGQPEPLVEETPGDARDVTRSPDGARIAFSSGFGSRSDIYVSSDGESPIRLTSTDSTEAEATWSADGQAIAFSSNRDGDPDIYAMAANGRGQRKLVESKAGDYEPAWSPDGMQIAFSSDRDGDEEIFVVNADGSGLRQLTENSRPDSRADWSPDGTSIVFTGGREESAEIFTMDSEGSSEVRLTENAALDFDPAWSADGTRIVFTSDRGFREFYRDTFNQRIGSFGYELWVMNADGSGLRRVTRNELMDAYPAWAP